MPWNDIRCNQPYILFIIYQDRAIRCNLTTDYNYILYCRKIEENLSSGEEQWRLQQNTCTRKYLCTSGKKQMWTCTLTKKTCLLENNFDEPEQHTCRWRCICATRKYMYTTGKTLCTRMYGRISYIQSLFSICTWKKM